MNICILYKNWSAQSQCDDVPKCISILPIQFEQFLKNICGRSPCHTHTHTEHGAKTLTRAPLIYTVREKIALEKNRKMVGNRKYSEVKFHTNNGRMRWQQQPHQFVKYKFMLKMVVVRYIYYENCKREREWATYIADSMTKQLTPRLMEYSVQRNFFFHF